MLPTHRIRRAGEDDLAKIMSIFEGRREWLRDVMHDDQWEDVPDWRKLVRYLIRHGNVWVLVDDDRGEEILGTVTLEHGPDLDFWTPVQRQQPALYLSKLATAQDHAGQGLGEVIMDWVVDRAAREGRSFVRLDTWKTSSRLQDYYAKRGWRNVGMVNLHRRQSGALFERDATRCSLRVIVDERRGSRRQRELVGAGSGGA